MSATIHYRKSNVEDPCLKQVWAPSSFMESMEKAFGSFPCVLTSGDTQKLSGMAAMCQDEHNPYHEIIDLIDRIGSIELYASY